MTSCVCALVCSCNLWSTDDCG